MKCILFVDDHPLYRDGFRRTIQKIAEDVVVVDVNGIGEAIRALEADAGFDLCLIDRRLADGDGLELAHHIRSHFPAVAVGLLLGEPTAEIASQVRALGGVACLSKSRDAASLAQAILGLFEGELIFDEIASSDFIAAGLTKRRREVVEFASQGLLDKQISEKLKISESTVRHHWKEIFKRLGASNRAEAVTKALLGQSLPRRSRVTKEPPR